MCNPPSRNRAKPTFLIERTVPGASGLSDEALQAIARTSCDAIRRVGPDYRWIQTYVAGDKFYCIHSAPSEEAVREHSRLGSFPIDRITPITATIDPGTADASPAQPVTSIRT